VCARHLRASTILIINLPKIQNVFLSVLREALTSLLHISHKNEKISRACPFGVVELPAAAEVDFPVVVELFVAVVIMDVAAVADVFVVATVVTVEMFCASAVCSTTERLSTKHVNKLIIFLNIFLRKFFCQTCTYFAVCKLSSIILYFLVCGLSQQYHELKDLHDFISNCILSTATHY
jgi:hypothetical protein